MRRAAFLSLLLITAACEQLEQAVEGSGGAAGASAGSSATDGGVSPAACTGFVDRSGNCLDPTCLETPACTSENALGVCGDGSNGPGVCYAGLCMYEDQNVGCNTMADCACGFCGGDGHCYTDRGGTCGTCASATGSGGTSQSGACQSCLSACQGTGPTCCAGCGCTCAGECATGC